MSKIEVHKTGNIRGFFTHERIFWLIIAIVWIGMSMLFVKSIRDQRHDIVIGTNIEKLNSLANNAILDGASLGCGPIYDIDCTSVTTAIASLERGVRILDSNYKVDQHVNPVNYTITVINHKIIFGYKAGSKNQP